MHVWSCAPGSQAGNVHDNIRQTQQQIRKYLCALLGTAQSRENGELWWHFPPGIHETQGFSTVDRLGACKSKESRDSCCGVEIPSVQYGEEICQSVYSSHSSAQKHDLLKENLEMQLLPHFKKGRKKKRLGGGRRKKPKRNQTKKPQRTIYYHDPSLQNVGVQHLAAYFPRIYSSTRQDWLQSHSKGSVRTRLL